MLFFVTKSNCTVERVLTGVRVQPVVAVVVRDAEERARVVLADRDLAGHEDAAAALLEAARERRAHVVDRVRFDVLHGVDAEAVEVVLRDPVDRVGDELLLGRRTPSS